MLLFQLIRLLLRAIDLYILLITIYIVLTWLPQAQNTKLARWLEALCEPYLSYFDKIRIGMFGFSAIFGILFLQFVKLGIIQILKFIF